jgi:hypothetical protein
MRIVSGRHRTVHLERLDVPLQRRQDAILRTVFAVGRENEGQKFRRPRDVCTESQFPVTSRNHIIGIFHHDTSIFGYVSANLRVSSSVSS